MKLLPLWVTGAQSCRGSSGSLKRTRAPGRERRYLCTNSSPSLIEGCPLHQQAKCTLQGKPPNKGMQPVAGWKLGHVLKCRSKGDMGEARALTASVYKWLKSKILIVVDHRH